MEIAKVKTGLIFTSSEFEQAFKEEIARHINAHIAGYESTEEFWDRVDKRSQEELSKLDFFISKGDSDRLSLHVYPIGGDGDFSEASRRLDIESSIEREIRDGDQPTLKWLAGRLEDLLSQVKESVKS